MISIYFRLASNAIKKNKALYLPYIFATSLLGIIYFLLSSLSTDTYVLSLDGGRTVAEVLSMGLYVIKIFASIFILYISLFISRKRTPEYGVLSVLGMEKKHLIGLIFVENLILCIAGIVISLFGGVAFYKIVQSLLLKTIGEPLDHTWRVNIKAFMDVLLIYLAVYVLIFLIQSISILRRKTIDVIKSSSKGEKMSKLDYVLGALGIIGLTVAYFIASSMPDDFKATKIDRLIASFAGDVVLVILATFLFFASGSALIFTLLRGIKHFYYKKTNFILLSGLSFRMRKNGVGLASICILFTMVIVSVAGLASFYSIVDPELITGISHNLIIQNVVHIDTDDSYKVEVEISASDVLQKLEESTDKRNVSMDVKEIDFLLYNSGTIKDGKFVIDYGQRDFDKEVDYSEALMLVADDVSKFSTKPIELKDNQIGVIIPNILVFDESLIVSEFDTIVLPDGKEYEAVYLVDEYSFAQRRDVLDAVYFVFPCSEEEVLERVRFDEFIDSKVNNATNEKFSREFFEALFSPAVPVYFIDFDAGYYEQKEIMKDAGIWATEYNSDTGETYYIFPFEQQAGDMIDFYDIYKGILFVAVALVVVFLTMSILVLYYKNVFDAYEDLKNFQIMRKVGLDERLIRKCVYAQMLITTLLPIVIASLHTLFAENFIKALISMFELRELNQYTNLTLVTTLVFIVVYVVIGIITSQVYIKIIKGKAY